MISHEEATLRAARIVQKRRRAIALLEQAEAQARPLEQAAHAILKARHAYKRSGQYPSLHPEGREPDDCAITEAGLTFYVSNGIDRADDFAVTLTWQELTASPDDVARARASAAAAARKARAAELRRQADRLDKPA